MKTMTVVNLKKGTTMACFECGNQVGYGLSRDGINIFRIVCANCLKAYQKGIADFQANGARRKGYESGDEVEVDEIVESTESE